MSLLSSYQPGWQSQQHQVDQARRLLSAYRIGGITPGGMQNLARQQPNIVAMGSAPRGGYTGQVRDISRPPRRNAFSQGYETDPYYKQAAAIAQTGRAEPGHNVAGYFDNLEKQYWDMVNYHEQMRAANMSPTTGQQTRKAGRLSTHKTAGRSPAALATHKTGATIAALAPPVTYSGHTPYRGWGGF